MQKLDDLLTYVEKQNRKILNKKQVIVKTINMSSSQRQTATPSTMSTTDDLPEGSTNLYFSEERVDDRVSSLLQDTDVVTWNYDDIAGTLTLELLIGLNDLTDVLVTSPQDNDVLIYDSGTGFWINAPVSGSGLQNIVEDTTPQLGGDLDINGKKFRDTNGNELVDFSATASAVNYIKINNSATTQAPSFQALGDDTNISLRLTPKGSGLVVADTEVYGPQIYKAVYANGDSGASITIDWANGLIQSVVLNSTGVTLAFSNVQEGKKHILIVKQGTGGSKTIGTYPASIKWGKSLSNAAPTLSTTANHADILVFIDVAAGSKQIGGVWDYDFDLT